MMNVGSSAVARGVRFAALAFVAFLIAFATTTSARADAKIDACFNAIADAAKSGIDAAKSGPDFVANNCEVWANPATADLFAAVVGVVTVLDAGGAFKGGDCKDFVRSKIAAALVAALAGAIGGNSPLSVIVSALPGDVQAEIEQLANNISSAADDAAANAAAGQAYDLLSQIPVIGQAIDMLPCACIVADAAIKAGSDLAQAAAQGGQCAEFALACVSSPLDCAESLFESGWDGVQDLVDWAENQLSNLWGDIKGAYCATLGHIFGGCPDNPPTPEWVDCVGGYSLGNAVDLGNGVRYSTSSNQICSCPPTMKWQVNPDTSSSCVCPQSGEVQVAYGICQCPSGTGLLDGSCRACPSALTLQNGLCVCPVQGQHINKIINDYSCSCPDGQATAGAKCAPICSDVSKILLGDGTCCSPSQVSSCGVCCPSGQRPDPLSGSCVSAPISKPGFTPAIPPRSK